MVIDGRFLPFVVCWKGQIASGALSNLLAKFVVIYGEHVESTAIGIVEASCSMYCSTHFVHSQSCGIPLFPIDFLMR